jgi:Putative serine esterase (DUF676)
MMLALAACHDRASQPPPVAARSSALYSPPMSVLLPAPSCDDGSESNVVNATVIGDSTLEGCDPRGANCTSYCAPYFPDAPPAVAACGNGVVDPGEECDDGAKNGTDPEGCNATCQQPGVSGSCAGCTPTAGADGTYCPECAAANTTVTWNGLEYSDPYGNVLALRAAPNQPLNVTDWAAAPPSDTVNCAPSNGSGGCACIEPPITPSNVPADPLPPCGIAGAQCDVIAPPLQDFYQAAPLVNAGNVTLSDPSGTQYPSCQAVASYTFTIDRVYGPQPPAALSVQLGDKDQEWMARLVERGLVGRYAYVDVLYFGPAFSTLVLDVNAGTTKHVGFNTPLQNYPAGSSSPTADYVVPCVSGSCGVGGGSSAPPMYQSPVCGWHVATFAVPAIAFNPRWDATDPDAQEDGPIPDAQPNTIDLYAGEQYAGAGNCFTTAVANAGPKQIEIKGVNIRLQAPPAFLFVHGINSNRLGWRDWLNEIDNFKAYGIVARAPSLGPDPMSKAIQNNSSADNADTIGAELHKYRKETKISEWSIVAHSKGGIDTINYLDKMPASKLMKEAQPIRIIHFMTINSPLAGSVMGDFASLFYFMYRNRAHPVSGWGDWKNLYVDDNGGTSPQFFPPGTGRPPQYWLGSVENSVWQVRKAPGHQGPQPPALDNLRTIAGRQNTRVDWNDIRIHDHKVGGAKVDWLDYHENPASNRQKKNEDVTKWPAPTVVGGAVNHTWDQKTILNSAPGDAVSIVQNWTNPDHIVYLGTSSDADFNRANAEQNCRTNGKWTVDASGFHHGCIDKEEDNNFTGWIGEHVQPNATISLYQFGRIFDSVWLQWYHEDGTVGLNAKLLGVPLGVKKHYNVFDFTGIEQPTIAGQTAASVGHDNDFMVSRESAQHPCTKSNAKDANCQWRFFSSAKDYSWESVFKDLGNNLSWKDYKTRKCRSGMNHIDVVSGKNLCLLDLAINRTIDVAAKMYIAGLGAAIIGNVGPAFRGVSANPAPLGTMSPQCSGRVCGPDGAGSACECDAAGNCASGPAGSVCSDTGNWCVPSCGSATCGSDGCGGACGSCPASARCVGGACCTPACTGACGASDGCGGTCCAGSGCAPVGCGTCQVADACGAACVAAVDGTACTTASGGAGSCTGGACACAPSCAGKACGPDGCGGSCGACSGAALCTAEGQCCTADCANKSCGAPDGCGGFCDVSSGCLPIACGGGDGGCAPDPSGKTCLAPDGGTCPLCVPNCDGKYCGQSDGCGDVCCSCYSNCIPITCVLPSEHPNLCGSQCILDSIVTDIGDGGCTPDCSGVVCGSPDRCGGFCCVGSGCIAVKCDDVGVDTQCNGPNECGSACVSNADGTECAGGRCLGGTCWAGGGQPGAPPPWTPMDYGPGPSSGGCSLVARAPAPASPLRDWIVLLLFAIAGSRIARGTRREH